LQDVRIARWDAGNSREPVSKIAVGISAPDAWRMAVSLPAVTPASITLQWLPHARFDHDAHTGFSCAGCHANALTSAQESDILIPGIATCQKCHAPGAGFAESRCFECHTYHDWAKRREVKPAFTMPGLQTGGL
ncbi:MAG TPA: cytochrome c3 family protein, partial [Candidatus Acidoferrum sp.]